MSARHQEPPASRRPLQSCKLLGGPHVFLSVSGANTTDSLFWSLKQIIRWRKWCVCTRKIVQSAAYQCTDPIQPHNGELKPSTSKLESFTQYTHAWAFSSKASLSPIPTAQLLSEVKPRMASRNCSETTAKTLPFGPLESATTCVTRSRKETSPRVSSPVTQEPSVATKNSFTFGPGGTRQELAVHKEVLVYARFFVLWMYLFAFEWKKPSGFFIIIKRNVS